MGFKFQKKNLTVDEAKLLISQCTVEEKLGYYQIKKRIPPKKFTMISITDDTFTIPYGIAIKNNYRRNDYPWYEINELKYKEGKNLPKIVKDSERFRPFCGEFRDYQPNIINDFLHNLEEFFTTTIGVFPGWGKTMAGSYLGWRAGLRMIILSPLTKVSRGWKTTFEIFLPDFKVWVVGEGPFFEDCDIILCMDGRFNQIPQYMVPTIGTVIADEMHILCTDKRVPMFLKLEPRYFISISATLDKANGYEQISHLIAGTHGVFRISTNPYNVYIIDTNLDIEEEMGNEGIITSRMRQAMCRNSRYQDIVCNILMMNCEYHKSMCIAMVKEGIPQLVNKLRSCGITADSMYGQKGNYENSQVLVATQQKGGTGFDEATACDDFYKNPIKSNLMIFLNTTPNQTVYEQTRGRIMRSENPIVIFLRNNNRKSADHIQKLMPWFRETNATVHYRNYWDLKLPRLTNEKIYHRIIDEYCYYKVITRLQRNEFEMDKILDRNDHDLEEEGHRIFANKQDAIFSMHKEKQSYLMKLDKLNVITVTHEEEKLFCTNPICEMNVEYIIDIVNVKNIDGLSIFENCVNNEEDISNFCNFHNFEKKKKYTFKKDDKYNPSIKKGNNKLGYAILKHETNVVLSNGRYVLSLNIKPGTVYILSGEAREEWYHGINHEYDHSCIIFELK